jgi:hypothetical protein
MKPLRQRTADVREPALPAAQADHICRQKRAA